MIRPVPTVLLSACLLLPLGEAALAQGQASSPAAPADAQGKVVGLQGRVEHTVAKQESWRNASLFQPLFVEERVRTLASSRAAILFIDETQVKLNAGSVLTVQSMQRTGGATILTLLSGAGWFRTKSGAAGVTVRTPAAAASIRGTEINVAVGADDVTVLTVIEGSVDFSNAQGSLLVNAGEEGTARPGQAPTKRVLLNPEDAVQWTLFYPVAVAWKDLPADSRSSAAAAGFEQLRRRDAAGALAVFRGASDTWARIGASMALMALDRVEEARAAVAGDVASEPASAQVELLAQRAAAGLAAGDSRSARAALDAALRVSPAALRPLVLLSLLELTQNHKAEASAVAARAVAAHPDSVGAHVAAAEAAQAAFDLPLARRELDRALAVDPDDLRALIDRARLRFGTSDTDGARLDIGRAAQLAPDDADVRSLQGFIRLADHDDDAAEADFTAAVQVDSSAGAPHLGLGLLRFRQQRTNEGLLEMLTATVLEPKVALYQSYLGKAYYQAQRFTEAQSVFATAKRLDPRDPTPWLYAALLQRDRNRQAEALDELQHAIGLNDNRAVYRSRFLLDRDLATKNVSLAEIYRQLGFEAWGAFEAKKSLDNDYTNASAHLFLADTYGRMPDRYQALASELLQYFLYAPVNRNSFNSFNEYTALLEQPRRQLSFTTETGSRTHGFGDVTSISGNERFAHAAFLEVRRDDGARPTNADNRMQAFFQGKLAFNSSSDLFLSANVSRKDAGPDLETVTAFGCLLPTLPCVQLNDPMVRAGAILLQIPIVQLREFTSSPNPLITDTIRDDEATIGFRHQWAPGSTFTTAATFSSLESKESNVSSSTPACQSTYSSWFTYFATDMTSSSLVTDPFRGTDWQAQQAITLGRHQVLLGAQVFRQRKKHLCAESITFYGEPLDDVSTSFTGTDSTNALYVRDEIQVTPWLHASVGVHRKDVTYVDQFGSGSFHLQQWDPLGGIAVNLSRSTVLRAAAFRNLNSNFAGSRISPTTVSGFLLERNEFTTARRKEADVSIEQRFPRAFVQARAFVRNTQVPLLQAMAGPSAPMPDADTHGKGGDVYVNGILGRRFSIFADDVFARTDGHVFVRSDNEVSGGINFIHPSGIFLRLTHSYVTQRYSNSQIGTLPNSGFHVTDFEANYEFARKAGLVTVSITNMLNQSFLAVVEGLSIAPHIPERRAILRFRWRI